MKFRAEADDGKAVLKGKVWKRGEQEPEAWTDRGRGRSAEPGRQPRLVRQRPGRGDLSSTTSR